MLEEYPQMNICEVMIYSFEVNLVRKPRCFEGTPQVERVRRII